MNIDPAVFDDKRRMDAALFAAVDRASLLGSLTAALGAWERRSFVDDEVLLFAGMAVRESGHAGVDEAVFDWWHAAPTLARQEIAADFLWGYWHSAGKVHAPSVTALLDSLDALPSDSTAYAATLLALFSVATARPANLSAPQSVRVRETLLAHLERLERSGQHPGVAASLEYLRP
ncbi:MAG TPA: hypothetical protein VF297_15960 [Pyrinomonadaceae bacterium]